MTTELLVKPTYEEGAKQSRRKRTGPSEQTTIRFPKPLLLKIRRIARTHNVSVGLVMTAVLTEHIDQYDVPATTKITKHSEPKKPDKSVA